MPLLCVPSLESDVAYFHSVPPFRQSCKRTEESSKLLNVSPVA